MFNIVSVYVSDKIQGTSPYISNTELIVGIESMSVEGMKEGKIISVSLISKIIYFFKIQN